jgi:hypothetical protein
MTQDEICSLLVGHGGREYRDGTKPRGTRCFAVGRLVESPPCSHNERHPVLTANAYPDIHHGGGVFPGTVEFEVFGEAGDGRWIKIKIYGVQRTEVEEVLADVHAAATASWAAFATAMNRRRRREEEHEEAEDCTPPGSGVGVD